MKCPSASSRIHAPRTSSLNTMTLPEHVALIQRIQKEAKQAKSRTRPFNAGFPKRLKRLRHQQGLTNQQLADLTNVDVLSASRWQSGATQPSFARAPDIASALGLPVAQLFTDDPVIAEVTLSPETLQRIKREGRPAAAETAQRLALMLEPLIWQEATRKPVDVSPGVRAKPRRNRAQVLAQGPKRHARKTIE